MEIEGSDGSKTRVKPYSTTVFGRENGFHPNDLAVSRRHISFEFNPTQTNPTVSFEVLGKNPLWVLFPKIKDAKIMVFKRFQRGQLGIGDIFCLSPKNPVWFTVKKVEDDKETKGGEINDELTQSLEISDGFSDNGEFGLDSVDVSSIDPVQEFGFLVIGHEFDEYPKQMIRDVKNWNWFLEDPRQDSDDEENRGRSGGGHRGKRKKTEGDDDVDDEWTGGGNGDEEIGTTKARKVQRPTYQTRSKERGKPNKEGKDQEAYAKSSSKEDDEEEEEEEDETLGGFIVEDETVKEEEDEEEEEEFVEDEDEDEEELEE